MIRCSFWELFSNIDCNNCFNDRNFNGKMNWNDVDWSNVDRSKISFDKSNFSNFDKTKIKDGLKANDSNNLRNRNLAPPCTAVAAFRAASFGCE